MNKKIINFTKTDIETSIIFLKWLEKVLDMTTFVPNCPWTFSQDIYKIKSI